MARLSGVVRHGPRVQAWEDQSNQVADALSRKAELASFLLFFLLEEIAAISQLKGAIPQRKGLEKDPVAHKSANFYQKDGKKTGFEYPEHFLK